MAIKIGNTDINAFKLGSGDTTIYLGDTLLYPTTPPTPTFDGKWKATYSDSHVESAQCDSSSAITRNEINLSNLVSVEIGDCVTTIGNSVFWNCSSLTSITIPNSVTSFGSSVFQECTSLTSVAIPSGVTSISNNLFDTCTSFTTIDIPSGVTSIGSMAFWNCRGLTSVTIGNRVTSIGRAAFEYCSGFQSITVNATTPPTLEGEGSWFNNTNECPIYVPSQSVEAYQSATNWSEYASRIQAIPNS